MHRNFYCGVTYNTKDGLNNKCLLESGLPITQLWLSNMRGYGSFCVSSPAGSSQCPGITCPCIATGAGVSASQRQKLLTDGLPRIFWKGLGQVFPWAGLEERSMPLRAEMMAAWERPIQAKTSTGLWKRWSAKRDGYWWVHAGRTPRSRGWTPDRIPVPNRAQKM